MNGITGNTVIVVSGLPRSGTSMMMRMLEAGGLAPFVDNIRAADEDNPRGYYEFEKVKQLDQDKSWLADARGKVVKVISKLLQNLPDEFEYKIIFMHRKMEEILASQRQMLIRRGKPTDSVSDEKIAEVYEKHLREIRAWIDNQDNMQALHLQYNEILENPVVYARQINEFLGGGLDETQMVRVVDRTLYRQRG